MEQSTRPGGSSLHGCGSGIRVICSADVVDTGIQKELAMIQNMQKMGALLYICACIAGCASEDAPRVSDTEESHGATPSWDEFRAHPPMTWEEFRAKIPRETAPPYRFVFDGDTLVRDEDELRDHYDKWLAQEYAGIVDGGSALTVKRVLGADVIWPRSQKYVLIYCVSNDFGARKPTVVRAMYDATRSWSDWVQVGFSYREDQDAACNNTNPNVLFNVRPWPSAPAGVIASSFFPDDARANRELLVPDLAFTTNAGGRDFEGILRHEIGHTLGFRHEHIWITCTGESTADARHVTSYDVNSVMHYPQCRPSGTGGYRQTSLDYTGAQALYGAASPPPPSATSDILWRHQDGTTATWRGADYWWTSLPGVLGNDWQIQGVGDFDGDGQSDILWRCFPQAPAVSCGQAIYGSVAIWHFVGGDYGWTTWPGALDFNWQIHGVGDFDGNGAADILWRCVPQAPATACGEAIYGSTAIWQFTGGNYGWTIWPGALDLTWQIRGVGDFDGNGRSDMLWRNADGSNAIWHDADWRSTQWLTSRDTGWQIQGVGEFDGDGRSDILWRHTSGATEIWLAADSGHTLSPGTLDGTWQIRGVGDFDGNGLSDILWRTSDGILAIWHDADVSRTHWIGVLGNDWQVAGVGTFD